MLKSGTGRSYGHRNRAAQGSGIAATIDASLIAPIISAVSQTTYPPQLSAIFDPTTLDTDNVRLQIATDLAFGSQISPSNPVISVGTGNQTFGLSGITTGKHYFRERIERSGDPLPGPWSNICTHGDTIAAVLSLPTAAWASDTTASLSVSTTKPEGTIFWTMLPAASSAPLASAIIAGTTGGVVTGSITSLVSGVNSTTATGIPVGVISNIGANTITATTAVITCTIANALGTWFMSITTSITRPSDADIIAGTGAVFHGSAAVTVVGAQSINATGLTNVTTYWAHAVFQPSTAYKVHYAQSDLASNPSNVASSASYNQTSANSDPASYSFTTATSYAVLQTTNGQDKSQYAIVSGSPALTDTGTAAVNAPMNVRASRQAAAGKVVYEVTIGSAASSLIFGFDDETVNYNGGFPVPGQSDTHGCSLYSSGGASVIYYNGAAQSVGAPGSAIAGDVFSMEYDPAGVVRFFRTRSGTSAQVGTDQAVTPFSTPFAVIGTVGNDAITANFGQSAFVHSTTYGAY